MNEIYDDGTYVQNQGRVDVNDAITSLDEIRAERAKRYTKPPMSYGEGRYIVAVIDCEHNLLYPWYKKDIGRIDAYMDEDDGTDYKVMTENWPNDKLPGYGNILIILNEDLEQLVTIDTPDMEIVYMKIRSTEAPTITRLLKRIMCRAFGPNYMYR